jgi:anti-sigma factor RsiW
MTGTERDLEQWLAAARDGELPPEEEALLEAHLAQDPRAAAHDAAARAFSATLKQARYHRAPAALVHRIRGEIAQQATPRPVLRPFAIPHRWAVSALAAAACLLLAWNLALQFERPGMLPLADEVVEDHVRSLMANHLTDVVSSDQHTVKPWFNGKLDLAPPVGDFGAQGFALIGGRLDYLAGHPVAALVYRHNEHVINLFVLPGAGADRRPTHLTARGYALLNWAKGGLDYWAVSDINPPELDGLPALVDSAAAPQQSE